MLQVRDVALTVPSRKGVGAVRALRPPLPLDFPNRLRRAATPGTCRRALQGPAKVVRGGLSGKHPPIPLPLASLGAQENKGRDPLVGNAWAAQVAMWAMSKAARLMPDAASRPRLLDLFCGAGGAAVGYHRAGFDVVGVDIKPQPNYPFMFIREDALKVLDTSYQFWLLGGLSDFDAIHASPPCQHYANVTIWRGDQEDHPDLIAPTRELLEATGLPWVMENVRTKELRADYMLCGTALGLPFRRHRHFETNWSGHKMAHPCQHRESDWSFDHGGKQRESVYRDAIGCDWMTVLESREAIPPTYTELIGHQLLAHIRATVPA